MATKQRVFSPNNTIHYDEYLKMKQGTECLKTINAQKHANPINLNQFINYDQFMALSKAFYKNTNINKYKHEPVSNLCNANISYIQHNQNTLKQPIDVCNSHVLYPYGHCASQQPHNLCTYNTCVNEQLQHIACNPEMNPLINKPSKINNAATLNGIVKNDQGFFQNKSNIDITGIPVVDFLKNNPSIDITLIPVVDLAYLSNVPIIDGAEEDDSDVIINLNPICLEWCDFITLFFRAPGGVFGITSNSTSLALTLLNQTYETTHDKYVRFSLPAQIRKAWSKKHSKNETSIPPHVNILLNRVGFLTKSLTSVKECCVGLSIDEAINTLLNNVEIIPSAATSTATVKFTISYKVYFEPLNTSVLVNFAYITNMPCYRNCTACFIQGYTDSNDYKNIYDTDDISSSSSPSYIPEKKCKTGLCKNAKQLFI
jgi:hypothetical protein